MTPMGSFESSRDSKKKKTQDKQDSYVVRGLSKSQIVREVTIGMENTEYRHRKIGSVGSEAYLEFDFRGGEKVILELEV